MSAFYVSDSCLTKCVTGILQYAETFGEFDISRTLPTEARRDAAGRIGQALRAMNIAALRARYFDRLDASETNERYEFTGYAEASPVELFKALDCLQYQCCEGDIPECNPLYRELYRVMDLIAHSEDKTIRTMRRTAEYQRGAWGD